MKKRHQRCIRRAFEPNRFASEQLTKVYEELKPLEFRTTAASSLKKPARVKRSLMKEGEK
jgi:hypothetical protein